MSKYILVVALLGGCSGGASSMYALHLGVIANQDTPSAVWSLALPFQDANAGLAKSKAFPGVQFVADVGDAAYTDYGLAQQNGIQIVHDGALALVADAPQAGFGLNRLTYDQDPARHLSVPIVCGICYSDDFNNPDNTSPDPVTQSALRNENRNFFRTPTTERFSANVLGQMVLNAVHHPGRPIKVGIIATPVDGVLSRTGGTFIAERFRDWLTAHAPGTRFEEILTDPTVPFPSWTSAIDRLTDDYNEETGERDGKPDIIVELLNTGYLAAFMKAFSENGYTVPILHPGLFQTYATAFGGSLQVQKDTLGPQDGVAYLATEKTASGDYYLKGLLQFLAEQGGGRNDGLQLLSQLYDAVRLTQFATLYATALAGSPNLVTPSMITDGLRHVNEPDGTHVGAGPDEFARAAMLLAAGKPINYDGASGPVDFDELGNVLGKFVHWRLEGGKFHDLEIYDCAHDPGCIQ